MNIQAGGLLMSKLALLTAGVLTLALTFAVACSDDDDSVSDAQGAEAEFCNDLTAFNAAMVQVRNLGPSSTVDQAKDARDNARSALEDLKDSARKAIEAQVELLEDTYDNFSSSLNDLDDDQTLAQAAGGLLDEVAQVQVAEANVRRGVSCP
jgi:hypothetical protein